jgi:1,4-dihydroxy-2-naphthoyl-CoA synthase
MRAGLHRDLASAMQLEIDAYNLLVGTEDRKEGLRAFNEKRKPEFKGR